MMSALKQLLAALAAHVWRSKPGRVERSPYHTLRVIGARAHNTNHAAHRNGACLEVRLELTGKTEDGRDVSYPLSSPASFIGWN